MKNSRTFRNGHSCFCFAAGFLVVLLASNKVGYAQTNTALGGAFSDDPAVFANLNALNPAATGGNNSAFGANSLIALTTASDNTGGRCKCDGKQYNG